MEDAPHSECDELARGGSSPPPRTKQPVKPYSRLAPHHEAVRSLREQGWGYHTISERTGVSVNTVIGWCCDLPVDRSKASRLAAIARSERAGFDALKIDAKKSWLIRERGHRCQCCKNEEWMGLPIPLELEHKDADKENNAAENLLLLCPNCHAQTPTWKRGKRALAATSE